MLVVDLTRVQLVSKLYFCHSNPTIRARLCSNENHKTLSHGNLAWDPVTSSLTQSWTVFLATVTQSVSTLATGLEGSPAGICAFKWTPLADMLANTARSTPNTGCGLNSKIVLTTLAQMNSGLSLRASGTFRLKLQQRSAPSVHFKESTSAQRRKDVTGRLAAR